MFEFLISHLFQELQFKLVTPKSITGSYFDTKLGRFTLIGSLMGVILDF